MTQHRHTADPEPSTGDLSHSLESPEQVAALIEFLDSPARAIAAVIVSPAKGTPRFPASPAELAKKLRGVADVYVLASAALSWELEENPQYRTYGGAVRVIGTPAHTTVIRTDGDPARALDRIVAAATAAGGRMPRVHAAHTGAREREHPDSRAADTAADRLAAEIDARRRAEKRAGEAESALSSARAEIAQLRAAMAAEAVPLFIDPEAQFRDDVTRSWLRQVAEPERSRWPLREFSVCPEFLDNLDFPQAPRRKIVEVVVDVLTRRAWEMSSRSVRAHGCGGPAGATGQVVRSDGAAGYRCNIRSNTAQAPRLVWWELTDGTVELVRASRHDDHVGM